MASNSKKTYEIRQAKSKPNKVNRKKQMERITKNIEILRKLEKDQ